MRGPSLQKTALLSFALHLTAFLIVLLILHESNHMVIPSAYTVSLVSSAVSSGGYKAKEHHVVREPHDAAASARAIEKARESSRERELVAKRIAELQQEKTVKQKIDDIKGKREKIRRLDRLRTISLSKANFGGRSGDAVASQAGGTIFDAYYAKITGEIWKHWIFPDIGRKNIEAIVSVKILKDGTAVVQGIEKSSGNALFDRSALRALAKASPLSRPPYEMEIGVRFNP